MTWVEIIGVLTEAGYSQTQLAEACNCTQSTISDIANGKNTDPRTSISDPLRKLHAKCMRRRQKAPEQKAA